MAKFRVEIIVSYPCVIDAQTVEEALQFAEDADWDDWPDDESEIVEYCAELVIEDDEDDPAKNMNVPPQKNVTKSKPKLVLVKGDQ